MERFELENGALDYHDGPLGGFLRCKTCGQRFAFECMVVVLTQLWHWTLVPVATAEDRAASEPWWLSVVEDRRHGPERYRAVTVAGTRARPRLGPV
jgi:hypothetical protein